MVVFCKALARRSLFHSTTSSIVSVSGKERWRARGYLTAAISINLLYTLLLVRVSYVQRNLSTAMSEKNISTESTVHSFTETNRVLHCQAGSTKAFGCL